MTKTTKLTEKQHEYFVGRCKQWCYELGLNHWEVYYDFDLLDGAYAKTYWNTDGMLATIVLAKEWDDLRKATEDELDKLALHEVLHVMFAELMDEAQKRYTTEDAMYGLEHAAIRRIQSTIWRLKA